MYDTALDHYAILKRVRVFCESNGFHVKFLSKGEPPSADSSGTISIAKPLPEWTEEQLLEWEMSVYHEIGHVVPAMRDIFPFMKEKEINMGVEDPELLPALLNIIDDYRQERNDHGLYMGRDLTLSKGHAQFVERHMLPKINQLDISKFPEKIQKIDAMLAADMKMRTSWQRDLIGIDDKYAEHLTPQQREWYDKVLTYQEEFDTLKTAEEEYDLLMRIIEEVFQDDPQEEEEKARQQAKEQGDKQGECSGKGNEDGDGKSGKGKGKGSGEGETGETRDQEAYIKYEDLAYHYEGKAGTTYHPMTIDYSTYNMERNYTPSVKPEIIDYVSGAANGDSDEDGYKHRIERLNISSGMANKLRKLLQVKSQSIKIYGQKAGKVSNKNVHRVTMRESGEYQRKIFKKKIDNDILDTAVTILVDFSGSMGGDKMAHAIASALLLNDALAKIGVPVEILGFTTGNIDGRFFIFKNHVKAVNREKLLDTMCDATGSMWNNTDGEAILWAYERLMQRKNKRKLLIVLSDGQPAGGRGDIYTFTKVVVKKIEEKHNAEIYGIGIMSNAVKNIYKHHKVIRSASELEPAILTVIKDYIIN